MTRTVRIPRRVYKQALLNTHYESYLKVLELQSWETPDAKFVPGDGDIMSPLVIVGEAPGAEEDRLGKPFVGKSGNLLLKWLKSIGLSRREVFITNLIKYRPPNNADPAETPAAAARALMRWELGILRPQVVVTLGKFASEVFYQNPKMSTLSGTCRKKELYNSADGVWVVPIFHPSYVLRGTSNTRHKALEHFQVVKDVLM
jgi:uracil-DNA glycosylase